MLNELMVTAKKTMDADITKMMALALSGSAMPHADKINSMTEMPSMPNT